MASVYSLTPTSGGGAPTNGTSGSIGTGAGGNSGAYVKVQLTPAQIGVLQLVTIGAGGIGDNNSLGSASGSSIFDGIVAGGSGTAGKIIITEYF